MFYIDAETNEVLDYDQYRLYVDEAN